MSESPSNPVLTENPVQAPEVELQALRDENARLRQILHQHGLAADPIAGPQYAGPAAEQFAWEAKQRRAAKLEAAKLEAAKIPVQPPVGDLNPDVEKALDEPATNQEYQYQADYEAGENLFKSGQPLPDNSTVGVQSGFADAKAASEASSPS